jgi:hypothetical protein
MPSAIFSEELSAPMHSFWRQQAAGIEFGGATAQAQPVLILGQAVDDALGAAENHSGGQDFLVGEFFQPSAKIRRRRRK